MSRVLTLAVLTGAGLALGAPAWAGSCDAVPAPVISVSHGSRYEADSKTRSDISAEGEAEIERALGPVDQFNIDLANLSNRALRAKADDKPEQAVEAADCLLDAVAVWAKADALTDIGTVSAKLSIPSRIGGIAMAYANALPLATDDPERKALIESWLAARAKAITEFFDGEEVEPRASRNNLRSWADLAVIRIGLSLGDDALVALGEASVRETLCAAGPDGSLPLEMQRGPLSLHYQIHALSPLVMATALLQARGTTLLTDCDGALPRIVAFTLKAIEDPSLIDPLAGEKQKFKPGFEGMKASEAAFLAPWLTMSPTPEAEALAAKFEGFANSKLGGDLTLFWPVKPVPDEGSVGN